MRWCRAHRFSIKDTFYYDNRVEALLLELLLLLHSKNTK